MKKTTFKKELLALTAFLLISALLTRGLWAEVKSRTVTISKKTAKYSVNVEYPQFANPNEDEGLKKINRTVEKTIKKFVKDFEKEASKAEIHYDIKWLLSYKYAFSYNDNGVINLVIDGYSFQGGAHGMPEFRNFLFDVKTGREYELKDLFITDSGWLESISDYCLKELKKRDKLETYWYPDGAAPKEKNYKIFCLENKNLVITFPPYQVAPYSEGPLEVKIPYERIKKFIKKGTPLDKVVKQD